MKVHEKANIIQTQIDQFDKFPIEFYLQKPEIVARDLIGKLLVRVAGEHIYTGMIAETEAYLAEGDLASHSAVGQTKRNSAMFETGGILYVYQIYGLHFCANAVTEQSGRGSAVLLRAVQPIIGIEQMKINRNKITSNQLSDGPAKLCQAFQIGMGDNRKSLMGDEIFIAKYQDFLDDKIEYTPRIGITKSAELLLRFKIKK
ncbi:MAG: DNA-3-methyladenine glycosylase [Ignavibacteriae bacterium HGW-Ignavibacteriae-1]|jgi:DNA-3-methyladenine glycosylase|nr:MAG: DNA-3-methyladenine glycosylase [Ignavibacteriae bacterium HGW-Ignavibacteriae-1]